MARIAQCLFLIATLPVARIKERLHSERHKAPGSSPNKNFHRSASSGAYMDGSYRWTDIRELFARSRVDAEETHLERRHSESMMVILYPESERSKRSVAGTVIQMIPSGFERSRHLYHPLRRNGSYDKVDVNGREWQPQDVAKHFILYSSVSDLKEICV